MVQVGTIEYRAKVTGADNAQESADNVTGSFQEMGEQAETTAASAGFLGGVLSATADDTERAGEEADAADTKFTLLKGTLGGVAARLGSLAGLGGGGGGGGLLAGAGILSILGKKAIPAAAVLTITGALALQADNVLEMGGFLAIGAATTLAMFGVLSVPVASVIALTGGITIGVSKLIDIATGGDGFEFAKNAGEEFKKQMPDIASAIHTAFTENVAFDLGDIAGDVLRGKDADFSKLLPPTVNAETREEIQDRLGADELFDFGGYPEASDRRIAAETGTTSRKTAFTPFASGGIVTQPTAAMIGEAGESEAVIPLSRLDSMVGGGGDDVTIEQVTFDLSGEFDPSNVGRRELDSLADRLTDLLGDKTNRRAGVR